MMEVLVKDLCKPDVVAAIAKQRVFFVKDLLNLTPEIKEKLSLIPRDMIHSVHHTQSVDPNDLEARLRDYFPRSSEPPTPEEWPDGYETPTEDPEEEMERLKLEAKRAYDTLIQMGGRPTRPIRPTPPWKKVLVGGELCYRYAEQDETLFYDIWYGYEPSPNTCLTEAGFIAGHWGEERGRCEEELRRWQDFRDTQQWIRKHRSDKARKEDMERQRYPHDLHLTASLKKLKDWKEYQAYYQRGIDKCKKIIEAARRKMEAIERKDPEVEKGRLNGRDRGDWLKMIEEHREWLAPEEKRLEWVKQQVPAVLFECAASLMELPTSRRQMEERSELEAKQVYNTLMDTGGRPSRPIRPVPDIHDAEHTDEHLHVLCHWEGECSRLEEELREWKKFLDYRQKKETNGKTEVQLQEQRPAEGPTRVDLWGEYRSHQQMEVENAEKWVEFWQRQVEHFQQKEDNCVRQGWEDYAYRHHSHGEEMRSYLEEARKQVKPAEMRLQWVKQQLSALLTECAVSSAEVSTSDHLEAQAITSKRSSRSDQLKGLRSDRSGRSTLRSNQKPDKNKKRVSANSALGPIHSSKVSKAAGRKTPRPQRQSKSPAERDDVQNQGLNITISPPPPANIAPRRSCRLSTNQKRSYALEADLAADLGRNAQPQPTDVMLRRSDRILKQKERMSTSTSSAASSSVVILQTAPFPRSKPKGRVAGIKPDRSWGKPRGISKTRGRDLSRKRTKSHT